MSLTLSTRHVGSVYVIQCTGRIVYGEEERALDTALNHAEHMFSQITLNLSGVTRLDSMGLGLLARHCTRLAKRGGAIHLAASPPFVTNLLELTRMSAILPNFDTEDEAILAFLDHSPAQKSDVVAGPRLLVFDPSADLCTFARTVLSQRGFNVQTTCSFGDAKLRLRVDRADYILVGPCSASASAGVSRAAPRAIAPRAAVLQLTPDFKSHDALEATELLLQMFDIGSTPHTPA